MSIEELKEKMKKIQNVLLEFLEDELNTEENYENFFKVINEYQMTVDKHKLKSILRLINAIGKNHQRVNNFISKIEQILEKLKKDINNYLSNSEIFNIFKYNKRILLFLIEEKIIIFDEYIVLQITKFFYKGENYAEYFAPEIKPFLTEEFIQKYGNINLCLRDKEFIEKIKKEVTDDFYIKRREGINENYLCELIRNNQVKEFGVYVNRNNISLDSYIEKSIFETNLILNLYFNLNLIEYASFYGSIDIIRFMRVNGNVELTSNMWIYAIHSRNAELIKYLEDNHVSPPDNKYERILEESIGCHHNDVSKYIIDYLMKEEDLQNIIENKFHKNMYYYATSYYNYCFFPANMKCKNTFLFLCLFDYYTFVKLYLEEGNIDINATINTSIF